jgi:parvulin-like peptidyl-prolyl isomerase
MGTDQDYQDLLNYRRYNLYVNLKDIQDSLNNIDSSQEGNEFIASFYQSQLEQLNSALILAPQDVLDELIEDALIREKAEELGFTATEAEVQQTIDADLQRAFSAPPPITMTDTEQIPTPTPVPQEQLDDLYNSAVKNIKLTDKKFRNIIRRSLLRQKVQDHLAGQVITTGLVAHVQLIQTETEEEALVAQMRVEAGEDFALVAQEVSTDTLTAEGGGDLGWVTTGQLSPRYGEDLENAVFGAEVGEIVVTPSGDMYYTFVVVERDENGPLPDQVVGPLQASALDNWLAERKTAPDVTIERLLDADQIPPDPFAVSQRP